MELPAEIRDAMVQHALEEDPNECCGILGGAGGIVLQHYRITNTEKSPYRYSMDGRELNQVLRELDDNGWEMQVIYHSHTHSPAYPSDTDVRLAANWPDPYYLLVSLMDKQSPDVRLFTIWDGTVTEEPVVIV
ncbi:MAG: M67 family metallopeptidase [Chloroflexi bacterium]|nr:M67 family metallopeptidase [Chloroflexota bacterium]MYA49785.1 M67 family metallopeptidase [Chloroflexota bacterium]MYK35805.1 M67 family metallopeptidase [Chloroflexota bacterium]